MAAPTDTCQNMSEPVNKTIQPRSQKRKRDRQYELLAKRARNWYAESPAPPNFCMFYLQKGVIISEGPPHMTEFFKDSTVLAKFKEVSLNRTVTFQNTECDERNKRDERNDDDDILVLPYADHEIYSWDAMVFLLPALLAKVGIKGKHAYTEKNRPTWWPENLRFCSPNSSSEDLMFGIDGILFIKKGIFSRSYKDKLKGIVKRFSKQLLSGDVIKHVSLSGIRRTTDENWNSAKVDCDQTGNKTDETETGNKTDETETGNKTDETETGNKTDETETGNKTDETETGNKTNETETGNKTDETETGNKTNETETGNKTDETETGNKTDETETGNKTNETETGNKTDETETGNKTDETETGNKTDETETCNKKDETETGNKTNETETGNKTDETEAGNKTDETETGNTTNETETGNKTDGAFDHIVLRYAQDLFLKEKKEPNFLITCCEGIPISLHNLYSIRDKLEDEIIDSYMQVLLRKNESKIEYLKCALLSLVLSKKHQHVVSDCDIVSDECMGICNVGRKHWILIIIKFKTQQFIVMDPLGESNMTMKNVFAAWINHLKMKKVSKLEMWNVETLPHSKQKDSTSCGVFCLMFAEKYINSSINPCQDLVMPYRHGILKTLLENPDVTSVLKLCRVCMREEPPRKKVKQIDWVGCEKCGMYWCHFSCLRVSQTLSNFASSKWFCRFCS